MKRLIYIEGPQATINFEESLRSLFKVSKDEVAKAEKKAKTKRDLASSVSKQKLSDKD